MELLTISKLMQKQRFSEALFAAQAYLNEKGICVDALNLMGVAHSHLNQQKEAKVAFEKAVNLYPEHFKSNLNLALTLIKLNNFGAAKELLKKCNELSIDNPEVLSSLGNLYRLEGKLNKSEQYLNKAASIAPNNPQIAENRAWLYLYQHKFDQAYRLFFQLNKAFPQRTECAHGLAETLINTSRFIEAESLLTSLTNRRESLAKTYYLLSKLEKNKGHQQKRVDWLNKALSITPDDERLIQAAVYANVEIGNKHSATSHILDLIDKDSIWTEAYFILLYACSYKLNQEQELHLLNNIDQNPKCYWLLFAAAKHFENKNLFSKSATYLIKARESFAKLEQSASYQRPFLELLANVNPSNVTDISSKKMIFVTGMPRSGTTLIDQILDSHPEVESIAESGMIAKLAQRVQKLTDKPYYKGVKKLTAKEKQVLIEDTYLEFGCESATIVDTTPNNIFYVNFILSFWPDAKVIICRRSPKDSCLSIFQHPLQGQYYANSQLDLAEYFEETYKLAESYIKKLRHSCLEVLYEDLVRSPEESIYDFLLKLDLPLSALCLSPEQNKRAVLTPSSTQVRQTIYTNAIGKYVQFEPYLPELFTRLETLEKRHQSKLNEG